LVYLFSLGALEQDILWLMLAPAFAPQFQWMYDALLRAVTGGSLPLSFVQSVLEASDPELDVASVVGALDAQSSLRRYGLLEPAPQLGMFRPSPRLVQLLMTGELGAPSTT